MNNIKLYRTGLLFISFALFVVYAKASTIDPPVTGLGYFTLDKSYDFDFCDICGCSGNGGSMGYGNTMNSNFFGVRYIHQSYNSKDGIFNNSPWVDENFNTVQLWSSIPVGNKITINAMLPYQFHHREFTNKPTENISGIGDATVIGFYQLYVTDTEEDWMNSLSKVIHRVRIGGGIKLPTGNYDNTNAENSVNPSFQVGTGSWDYILATDYSASYKNWGATVILNYTLKTENGEHYKFGDQLNCSLDFYRTISTSRKLSFTPFVGLAGEVYQSNEQYGQTVANTKGDILFSKFGVETSFSKFSLGLNTMLPLYQDLNSGLVKANYRMGIYLNYNL